MRQRKIQSIGVGFRIIHALERAGGKMSLKQLAAAAGMSAGKAHPYVVSFMHEGLIRQDSGTGQYALGPYAIQIGVSAIRQADAIEFAREELLTLCERSRQSVFLSIWGNRGPTIVSKLDGESQGPMTIRVGYVLPVLTSATGRVFTAFLPVKETAAMIKSELSDVGPRASSQHPRSMSAVERTIAAVRAEGYATSENMLNEGFASVSAPIFGIDGQIQAAMTVLGRIEELNAIDRDVLLKALRDATGTVSARLGWTPRDRASTALPQSSEGPAVAGKGRARSVRPAKRERSGGSAAP